MEEDKQINSKWKWSLVAAPAVTVCLLIFGSEHAVKLFSSCRNHNLKSCQPWSRRPPSSFTPSDPSRSVCLICTRCFEVTAPRAAIVKSNQRAASLCLAALLNAEQSNRNQKLLTLMKYPPSLPKPGIWSGLCTRAQTHTSYKRVTVEEALQIQLKLCCSSWLTTRVWWCCSCLHEI